jgi:hypothetical protein
MNPTNYLSSAIPALREFRKLDLFESERKRLDLVLDELIPNAVRYVFDIEHCANPKDLAPFAEYLRLPHPCVAVEYFFRSERALVSTEEVSAPKRILLCASTSLFPDSLILDSWVGWESRGEFIEDAFVMIPIWGVDVGSAIIWCPASCWLFIKEPLTIAMEGGVARLPFSCAIPAFSFLAKGKTGDDVRKIFDRALRDTELETIVILSLLLYLNARGVEVRMTPVPSKKLNNKRAKQGKPPLLEYKYVDIGPRRVAYEREPGTGHHASPRLHIRRGHVRRSKFGKPFWVREHPVGDASLGVIAHGYKVGD